MTSYLCVTVLLLLVATTVCSALDADSMPTTTKKPGDDASVAAGSDDDKLELQHVTSNHEAHKDDSTHAVALLQDSDSKHTTTKQPGDDAHGAAVRLLVHDKLELQDVTSNHSAHKDNSSEELHSKASQNDSSEELHSKASQDSDSKHTTTEKSIRDAAVTPTTGSNGHAV
jgi:uncharacterized membrane protein YdfJ with MMPL/SSD domain